MEARKTSCISQRKTHFNPIGLKWTFINFFEWNDDVEA